MSKPPCFNKWDAQLPLITKHPYRVSDADGLGPLCTATCTLEFPKKFQQQFIICEHWLGPMILGLDFSHNYQIGIDWFSTHQLHLHQGPNLLWYQTIHLSHCISIKYPHYPHHIY